MKATRNAYSAVRKLCLENEDDQSSGRDTHISDKHLIASESTQHVDSLNGPPDVSAVQHKNYM